jgi:hypothetical protein
MGEAGDILNTRVWNECRSSTRPVQLFAVCIHPGYFLTGNIILQGLCETEEIQLGRACNLFLIYPARVVIAEDPSALDLVVGHGVRAFIFGLSNTSARMVSTENSPAPKISIRTDANRKVYGSAA